ncbi:MAG TPA: hypothetical protein VEJ63_07650 [Planctomycetota bacterium]|nr:hypothetical protein [Planctomycetota bacterium]
MPRPGYEPEEDLEEDRTPEALLRNFGIEARELALEKLQEGKIKPAHVLQIYRLWTAVPEERDGDFVLSLVETAARMHVEEFTDYVSGAIASWRDR